MIDLCDKTIYISNVQVKPIKIENINFKIAPINLISQVGHKFSQTYCCGKAMRPLALETLNVQNCFKNKIFGN